MEKELLENMVGKRISFHKHDNKHLLFGDVIKVTDTAIKISFRGRAQVHALDSLVDVEECSDTRKFNDRKRWVHE